MGRQEAPLPAGPLGEFAQALRDLRAQAPGAPTYRELADRARYSRTALSDAASGRRMPSWEVTAAFVAACDGDPEQWRERWNALDAQLRPSAAVVSAPHASPRTPAASVSGPPTSTDNAEGPSTRPAEDAGEADQGSETGPATAPIPSPPTRSATTRRLARPLLGGALLAVVAALAVIIPLASGGSPHRPALAAPAGSHPPTAVAGTRPSAGPPTGAPRTPTATPSPSATGADISLADHTGGGQSQAGASSPAAAASHPAVPAAPAPPATTWQGYSGTSCSSGSAAPAAFNGDWHTTTGGAYQDGCKAAKYVRLTGGTNWTANADWVFIPGTAVTGCTFTIHIAAGTWTSQAQYEVYTTDSTNNGSAQPEASFTVDQSAYDGGGWYTTARYPTATGTIDLALTNAGTGRYGVVADIVTATCR